MYAVILEDRSVDVEVWVFTNPQRAIFEARRKAKEYSTDHGNFYEEYDQGNDLFYAEYSYEGDRLRVVSVEVDRPLSF